MRRHIPVRRRTTTVVSGWRRLCLAFFALVLAAPVAAQSGDGSTAGAVLALPAGSRAAAMGGAYAAGRDVDVLFYNPAGAARLGPSAAVSYERHLEDITFASVAALVAPGALRVALTFGYLDFGAVDVLEPDPAFGGQRGLATGQQVDAGEGMARLLLGLPLPGGRAAIGVAAGVLYSTLAESGRGTLVLDGGLQYDVGQGVHAGLVLRNFSSGLEGARVSPASLPRELRAGLAQDGFAWLIPGATIRLHADVAANLETDRLAGAAGVELAAALIGGAAGALRAGYDGTNGPHGLGRLHGGAGLSLAGLSVDYAVQHMAALGTIHRFGVRWSKSAR